jgi:hypothetical protein
MRCDIGKGIYLDWDTKEAPTFRPSNDTTASFAVFNVSEISLSTSTARIIYDTGIFDVRALISDHGIHFVKLPYQIVTPEVLSVYTYPGPGVDSAGFAAVWSGHADIGGMPMPQLYFGSCHPVD